jgi:hypothetical protein
MLRLVCGARGPLPNALPVLATQLEDLGVSSYWKLVSYSFFRIKWLGFLLLLFMVINACQLAVLKKDVGLRLAWVGQNTIILG